MSILKIKCTDLERRAHNLWLKLYLTWWIGVRAKKDSCDNIPSTCASQRISDLILPQQTGKKEVDGMSLRIRYNWHFCSEDCTFLNTAFMNVLFIFAPIFFLFYFLFNRNISRSIYDQLAGFNIHNWDEIQFLFLQENIRYFLGDLVEHEIYREVALRIPK